MTAITGQLWPQTFKSGQKVKIRLENLPPRTEQVSALVMGTDSVESSWRMTIPLELGGSGTAYADVEIPLQPREVAMYISAVIIDGDQQPLPMVSFSICDPKPTLGRSDEEVLGRYQEILKEQNDRYNKPLGDATVPGTRNYRVSCVIQDLLLTAELKLPGIRAFGMAARPKGKDAEELSVTLAEQLGWASRPSQPGWSQMFERDHPVAALVYESVYADSFQAAFDLCAASCTEVLAVLALNRRAAGRPVVMCLEEIENGKVVSSKFRFEHPTYSGNLAGGFLSGESQSQLLLQQAALSHDPLLRLCVDLYREALADSSPDGQYFRLWSALETLAIGRVPEGQPVTRLDGTPWPNNLTSNKAAPRVYKLIADNLFRAPQKVDESSVVAPSADLASAVSHWYARRNATAHYGRFVPGDPSQLNAHWYSRALVTLPAQQGWDEWLNAFRRICSAVLGAEMSRVGASLIT